MPAVRKPYDKRNTAAWQALVKRVIAEEPTCWLRLPGCTVKSTTADHVIPVAVRPELCLIRANLRGACSRCNTSRGSKSLTEITTRKTVAEWFD